MSLNGARVGDYKIRRFVRPSARGTLHLARHVRTGRDVMLEIIDADPGLRKQIALETRAASKVQHRGIVDLLDQGISKHGVWFATEWVRGESLTRRLERARRLGRWTWLDAEEIAIIFQQLIDIAAAFQKITLVHGGLDVSQVVLEETPAEKVRVRLLDFGIVRKADKLFAALGSSEKEEAEKSAARADKITRGLNVDVQALGALLDELLPRSLPRDPHAREHNYKRIAALCTADKPGKQLRNCEELGRQFQLASVKVNAPVRRSRWMYAFLAMTLFSISLVLRCLFWHG